MIPVEVDGKTVLGFDTGLDSRSFAQAKFAQFMSEPGYIVRGGRIELWKAGGVVEKNTMAVWGPLFEGRRLDDLLLNENKHRDETLAIVVRWMQAVIVLGENAPLRPCAAIIGETGVFFAPPSLARRCLTAAGETGFFSEQHVHPDLEGMDAIAFTAAVMLYHVFAGHLPFTATDESLLHQDMREGNFLPIRFAVPGLNERLAALIQNALDPQIDGLRTEGFQTGGTINRATLLNELLAILHNGGQTVSAASLIQSLSEENRLLLEKEKAQFLKIKTASVKTKRFVMRNITILTACAAALAIVVMVAYSIAKSRSLLPSVAGMEPVQVIESYYNAFGDMDHQMMEACVMRDAGKNDINMVINLFVITKVRQSYEMRSPPMIISAREWQDKGGGGALPSGSHVFGVTDLCIEQLTENKVNTIHFLVNYTLWVPAAAVGEVDNGLPLPYYHSDLITLVQQKKGWRITEIIRD